MGAARDHENSDEGHGYVPKLILAGRLTGTLNGRPVVIEAGESGLIVIFAAVRTAWVSRKTLDQLLPALQWLRRGKVPVRLRIAGLLSVELLPDASAFAKLIVPSLSRLD